MKGLDKQIEEILERSYNYKGTEFAKDFDDLKSLIAQAVQEALAKHKAELLEKIDTKSFRYCVDEKDDLWLYTVYLNDIKAIFEEE